ncbi:exosortase A [Novosphingobium flavum]|uniref:Exosortase A n=1 Tax=Novosphingobium flavum TaxID=1778672 RepID=A0A7X1FSW8_9SPHN|nr:exosortase A [Novosphingobium flavum]MBC2666351.1 exosortase A [Novosphingobium flavum]
MPPEAAARPSPAPGIPAGWRAPLAGLGAVTLALLIAFARDWAEMAGQWWNSSTYNHVVLIPPILGWLVWQRWPQLSRLAPAPWWPGLVLFALALFGWVLGTFAGFSLVSQAGAVAMLGAAVLALLGPRIGWALAFPLGYMAFLVPFGDELIPPLQTVTAKLTIALVHLSGIPAAIDGVFIDTPAGLFEVAEACSGIKFLIAMIAFGVLAAHLCFTSPWRRAAFLVLCAAIPVLANGVRAWGTIAVAQVKGTAWAGGFDHIIYGWIFFGAVIAAIIALSWRFFDRAPDAAVVDPAAIERSALLAHLSAQRLGLAPALTIIALLTAAGQGWAAAADRLDAPLPRQIHLPEVPGWHRANYAPLLGWQPRASGAEHRLLGRYADDRGHTVDVFFALYSGQSEGREAGGFGEGALTPESGWAWRADGPAVAGGKSERLLGKGRAERLAETYYRTGSLLTGSNMRLKLANIADRLLLRPRPTMLLILSAEAPAGSDEPERAVNAFRASAGPLDRWMDRVAQVR